MLETGKLLYRAPTVLGGLYEASMLETGRLLIIRVPAVLRGPYKARLLEVMTDSIMKDAGSVIIRPIVIQQ